MNETEKYRLLRLYKLLWEQIKDDEYLCAVLFTGMSICDLWEEHIITQEEMDLLYDHFMNQDLEDDSAVIKAFVQRMIKELENDK